MLLRASFGVKMTTKETGKTLNVSNPMKEEAFKEKTS
jgi:hypothetical protein